MLVYNKMDKQRQRMALKVLDEARIRFPDIKQFIEDLIDEECLKEKISVDQIIFSQVQKQSLRSEKFFYFVISMSRDIVLS